MEAFSDDEQKAWLASQPAKPISSKLLVRRPDGRVLVLKPSYKPGWDFSGGMVNEHESPLRAAIREAREEIGLELTEERLAFVGLRYGYSERKQADYLHVLFSVMLSEDEASIVKITDGENTEIGWIRPDEVEVELNAHFATLAQNILNDPNAARYSDNDDYFL